MSCGIFSTLTPVKYIYPSVTLTGMHRAHVSDLPEVMKNLWINIWINVKLYIIFTTTITIIQIISFIINQLKDNIPNQCLYLNQNINILIMNMYF